MDAKQEITFVFCVESGYLESLAIRLVASLRRFAGRYRDCRLIAVTPRRGPQLSPTTLRFFETHSVDYLRRSDPVAHDWFNFLNKPLALVAAEEVMRTPYACFLDSDLLFVGEPDELGFGVAEDFLGFPVEIKEMGTSGPGDPYEPLWARYCEIAGLAPDDLPWVQTALTDERVRLYINGGVLAYRRGTRFARLYYENCSKLLDARVISRVEGFGPGIMEMISIGFAIVQDRLRWRALSYSHNFAMQSLIHNQFYRDEDLAAARIVHHHDMLWPPTFGTFLQCLQRTHPDAAGLIERLGPLSVPPGFRKRLANRLHRAARKRREIAYLSTCTFV